MCVASGTRGRALSQGRRAHITVIEGRAGAGRITIQLGGGANLFLHHTHNNKSPPSCWPRERLRCVRAPSCTYAHTYTRAHAFFFFYLSRRMKRRENKMEKQESRVQPLESLTSPRCSAKECFLHSLESIQSITFFPQPEIPKFSGRKRRGRGRMGVSN